MGKASSINWWLKFGQINMESADGVLSFTKWHSELRDMINNPEDTCHWLAAPITPDDAMEFWFGASAAVNALKKGKTLSGSYRIETVQQGMSSCRWINTKYEQRETATALILEAMHDAGLEPEQYKICNCGKLFAQSGKREKKYCSDVCRAMSNKTRVMTRAKDFL